MIRFSEERWQRVRETSRRWWTRELGRPMISVALGGADPGRPEPDLGCNQIQAACDLELPAQRLVDWWDWQLSGRVFLGDGFPSVRPNMGPGCNAGFMGARPVVHPGTVWFTPEQEQPITKLRFRFDPKNPWFQRALEISRTAVERWQGSVCFGLCDMVPNLDILSVFRPAEKLLLDLYDHPAEVKRLVARSADVFWQQFDGLQAVMQPRNRGYTCWAPIYSAEPYHMFQCDFCYMIGPDMFDEFVKPDLVDACRRVEHSFYHLDGPGQLPHLDSILRIPELDGVQWIPGAGQPDFSEWPDVYRKIHEAGKLIQLFGDIHTLDTVARQIGTAEGICLLTGGSVTQMDELCAACERYGC